MYASTWRDYESGVFDGCDYNERRAPSHAKPGHVALGGGDAWLAGFLSATLLPDADPKAEAAKWERACRSSATSLSALSCAVQISKPVKRVDMIRAELSEVL